MIGWLKRLVRWKKAPAPVGPEGDTAQTSIKTIALWGPTYDVLTNATGQWLRAFVSEVERERLKALIGPEVCRRGVESILTENKLGVIAIFCGHGIAEALLGPPNEAGGNVNVNGSQHSLLYSKDDLLIGPQSMFAFCCRTAVTLGSSFASLRGRTFLGFFGDIPLNLMNEECASTWRILLHGILSEIVKDLAILEKHEQLMHVLYDEAFAYYSTGPGKKNDQELLMRAQILRHKKLLRFYQGA